MYKRILNIQDISCAGQCSWTVALPILSACGLVTVITLHLFSFGPGCPDDPLRTQA